MEVINGEERQVFQNDALDMLDRATRLTTSDATLFYQYALQLGEVGEV